MFHDFCRVSDVNSNCALETGLECSRDQRSHSQKKSFVDSRLHPPCHFLIDSTQRCWRPTGTATWQTSSQYNVMLDSGPLAWKHPQNAIHRTSFWAVHLFASWCGLQWLKAHSKSVMVFPFQWCKQQQRHAAYDKNHPVKSEISKWKFIHILQTQQ